MAASAFGFIAMFRNVTSAVSAIAQVNNYILPPWLVVLGVAFARERARD